MRRPAEYAPIVPRLLDIQQVAVYTGLSVHTLYTMVSHRRVPFVKLGRLTKFDREEIDKWITAHSVKVRRPILNSIPLTTGS
jgi:excisionase family DNA binding protein